jgi:hypothetical protein
MALGSASAVVARIGLIIDSTGVALVSLGSGNPVSVLFAGEATHGKEISHQLFDASSSRKNDLTPAFPQSFGSVNQDSGGGGEPKSPAWRR